MEPLEYCETHDDHYDQGSQCPHCIADRSARLARIDETARHVFALSLVQWGWTDGSLPQDASRAYQAALALERARDEAVKKLDKEPR